MAEAETQIQTHLELCAPIAGVDIQRHRFITAMIASLDNPDIITNEISNGWRVIIIRAFRVESRWVDMPERRDRLLYHWIELSKTWAEDEPNKGAIFIRQVSRDPCMPGITTDPEYRAPEPAPEPVKKDIVPNPTGGCVIC